MEKKFNIKNKNVEPVRYWTKGKQWWDKLSWKDREAIKAGLEKNRNAETIQKQETDFIKRKIKHE